MSPLNQPSAHQQRTRGQRGAPLDERSWLVELPAEAVAPKIRKSCENVLRHSYNDDGPPLHLEFQWNDGAPVKIKKSRPMLTVSQIREAEANLTAALVILKFTLSLINGRSEDLLSTLLQADSGSPDRSKKA